MRQLFQFEFLFWSQTMVADVRRIGNDGWEFFRQRCADKISDLHMIKVIRLQAEFPAVGKGIGVKFKTVELTSKSCFPRRRKKSSRTNRRIKEDFRLVLRHPASHDFCQPWRCPELSLHSQGFSLVSAGRKFLYDSHGLKNYFRFAASKRSCSRDSGSSERCPPLNVT